MADQKREPGAQYGYGPPDGASVGYYDDPTPFNKAANMAFDFFVIFAVAFTIFVGGKKLLSLVNRKLSLRGSRQAAQTEMTANAPSDRVSGTPSPATPVVDSAHEAPRS
jgi:hypothetical protein